MIKIVLCFFILSVIPLSNNLLIAQSNVIKVIGGLIEEGKIDEADKKYAAHPFVVPHESYLTYDAQPEEGNADIFISFREKDLTWGKSVFLGEKFNTELEDMMAFVSRDGKYLFFSRLTKQKGGKYWVDAKMIKELCRKNKWEIKVIY